MNVRMTNGYIEGIDVTLGKVMKLEGFVKGIYNTLSRIRKRKVVGKRTLQDWLDRIRKVKMIVEMKMRKWEGKWKVWMKHWVESVIINQWQK